MMAGVCLRVSRRAQDHASHVAAGIRRAALQERAVTLEEALRAVVRKEVRAALREELALAARQVPQGRADGALLARKQAAEQERWAQSARRMALWPGRQRPATDPGGRDARRS